jgi:uncharacterized SAM-binding protein YcdF (DUF218 family)
MDATLAQGQLAEGAARRRVLAAADHWRRTPEADRPAVLIASGGRRWEGRLEADAMAAALAALGVPAERIVRERLSHTTRENARYVAAECARRGIDRVAIVSCLWHLPRAVRLFEAQGLEVIASVPAREVPRSLARSLWLRARERMLLALAGR